MCSFLLVNTSENASMFIYTWVCDNVCQWFALGRWVSPDTPLSSTNKTDHHDITGREKENLDTLSFWMYEECESLPMSICKTSIFKDPNVAKHLSNLHDKYVVVPADKFLNNFVYMW